MSPSRRKNHPPAEAKRPAADKSPPTVNPSLTDGVSISLDGSGTLGSNPCTQRLLAEIDDLPPDELETVYKMVVFIRDEFIDVSGEERYIH